MALKRINTTLREEYGVNVFYAGGGYLLIPWYAESHTDSCDMLFFRLYYYGEFAGDFEIPEGCEYRVDIKYGIDLVAEEINKQLENDDCGFEQKEHGNAK